MAMAGENGINSTRVKGSGLLPSLPTRHAEKSGEEAIGGTDQDVQ
jgi:hypothetical protein